MNVKSLIIVFFSLPFLLAGCATLNESECRNADWYMIGIEDGMNGHLTSRIGEHRRACSKFNVTPDINAYRKGHAEGLLEFCTQANGFAVGNKGIQYNGVCPTDLEPLFLQGYQLGRDLYELNMEINASSNAIYTHKKQIKELNKKIHKNEQTLVQEGTTRQERENLLSRIKEQQKKIGELEQKILDQEKYKAVLENEYSKLQMMHRY